MKHVFILNPAAGKAGGASQLEQRIRALDDARVEIYYTKCPGDATNYVRALCEASPEESFRFYACGGDGTLNEVVCGALDQPNAAVGIVPCGSGNDFVKAFGGRDRFEDLTKQLTASELPIDVMMAGDRPAVNVVNFGFDSNVCMTMIRVRRKPVIGGKNAYTTGVVNALLRGMRTKCTLTADGSVVNDGDILLCTVANGQYVGGSYRCGPRSKPDDGLMDLDYMSPISRVKFLSLVKSYQRGDFLENPKFEGIAHYRQAREITVDAPGDFWVCIDGEMYNMNHFTLKIREKALRFLLPET